MKCVNKKSRYYFLKNVSELALDKMHIQEEEKILTTSWWDRDV